VDTALDRLNRDCIEYGMIEIKLPFWLEGTQLTKLVAGATAWWALAETWIKYPLTQFDEMTCAVAILDLLAYQRDIQRFAGEPLSLYRKRVKTALINVQDAGSVEGFIAIFARLELGVITLTERFDDVDWDVILINITDEQLAGNEQLLIEIIRLYGRTCRRYYYTVTTNFSIAVGSVAVGVEYDYSSAKLDVITPIDVYTSLTSPPYPIVVIETAGASAIFEGFALRDVIQAHSTAVENTGASAIFEGFSLRDIVKDYTPPASENTGASAIFEGFSLRDIVKDYTPPASENAGATATFEGFVLKDVVIPYDNYATESTTATAIFEGFNLYNV